MSTVAKAKEYISTLGRAGLHVLFPNDFEYYAITLELTDSKGVTVDYLTFPVNPENIDFTDSTVTNVKKTLGGVTALDSTSFVPKQYTLSGTFGRGFKLLINNADSSPESSTSKGTFDLNVNDGIQVKTSVLSARLKTGYGAIKVLESMIKKSRALDDYNKPHRLYLYNPTLNHNFLVKVDPLTLLQDKQTSNMIWRYNLVFKVLYPIDQLQNPDGSSLIKNTLMSVLNKGANKLVKNINLSI